MNTIEMYIHHNPNETCARVGVIDATGGAHLVKLLPGCLGSLAHEQFLIHCGWKAPAFPRQPTRMARGVSLACAQYQLVRDEHSDRMATALQRLLDEHTVDLVVLVVSTISRDAIATSDWCAELRGQLPDTGFLLVVSPILDAQRTGCTAFDEGR